MQPRLEGVTLALIGGDAREIILAERLAAMGAHVKAVGLPAKSCRGIEECPGIEVGLQGINALILPVPGINDRGELHAAFMSPPPVLTVEQLSVLPQGTPVLVGVARKQLREMAESLGLKLVELMRLDEVAILNSIPSAEGAIQMAMENSDITLHGSKSLVLGFGRTGLTLALKLKALGSNITVIARNSDQRARASAMGLWAADFSRLALEAADADFLFNTVPAIVLDENALEAAAPSALIIDLASSPGGTDFPAARRRNIKAILAPGLPGKVAPKTAGRILAEVVPRILAKELALA